MEDGRAVLDHEVEVGVEVREVEGEAACLVLVSDVSSGYEYGFGR